MTEREAESLALNLMGLNTQPELDPGEKLALQFGTSAILVEIAKAQAEARAAAIEECRLVCDRVRTDAIRRRDAELERYTAHDGAVDGAIECMDEIDALISKVPG